MDMDQETALAQQAGVEITVRALVEAKSCGGIIGKQGATINQLRTESGSFVDVGGQVPGASKRVITVRGPIDCVAKALHLVADLLATNRLRRAQGEEFTGLSEDDNEVSITLLIPNVQIGGVMGKGGSKINATRESSGANIRVSDKTLDQSSEKSCSIRGTSEQVYKALVLIVYQINENADKIPENLYWPKPDNLSFLPQAYGGADYGQYNAMAAMQLQQGLGGLGGLGAGSGAGGSNLFNNPHFAAALNNSGLGLAAQTGLPETIVIPIPEALIGYVIGKGGSTINEIRRRSNAQIKINNKEGMQTERLVNITGARSANEVAVALINEKLAQYDGTNM